MADIRINPDVLDEKAANVRSLKEEHDSIIENLRNLINGLNEIWTGEAQTAFIANFEGMRSTFDQFSEMLEGYAKLMNENARVMRETDEQLKNMNAK